MGVQTYLLERRSVTLLIDGKAEKVETLRQFGKVTELNAERTGMINAVTASFSARPAPVAVMVADVVELPLASDPGRVVGSSPGFRLGGGTRFRYG